MMNHWIFKCEEVSKMISRSMDEKLPLGVRIGIKFHLMVCLICRRYEKQMLLIRGALGRIKDDDTTIPQMEMPEAAKHRIKNLLN